MADSKLADLTAVTTPTDDDLLYVVDDPAGTPADKKLTWADLKSTLSATFVAAAGKAGGQTVAGGTAASEELTLSSTAHATKGRVKLAASNIFDLTDVFVDGLLIPPSSAAGKAFSGSSNNHVFRADALDTVTDVNASVTDLANMFDLPATTLATLGNSATNTVQVIFASSPEDHRPAFPQAFWLAFSAGSDNVTRVRLEWRTGGVWADVFDDTDPQNSGFLKIIQGNNAAYQRFFNLTGAQTVEGVRFTIVTGAGTAAKLRHACLFGSNQREYERMLRFRDGSNTIVQTKTSAYTITDVDDVVLASASGGAFTVTLPTAVGRKGRVFHIKKTDSSANAVTVDGNAAETIDGSATRALSTQHAAMAIVSDGSNWHRLAVV